MSCEDRRYLHKSAMVLTFEVLKHNKLRLYRLEGSLVEKMRIGHKISGAGKWLKHVTVRLATVHNCNDCTPFWFGT